MSCLTSAWHSLYQIHCTCALVQCIGKEVVVYLRPWCYTLAWHYAFVHAITSVAQIFARCRREYDRVKNNFSRTPRRAQANKWLRLICLYLRLWFVEGMWWVWKTKGTWNQRTLKGPCLVPGFYMRVQNQCVTHVKPAKYFFLALVSIAFWVDLMNLSRVLILRHSS